MNKVDTSLDYECAIEMFQFRIRKLNKEYPKEAKYVIEILKELTEANFFDPEYGPLHKIELSNLNENMRVCVKETNGAAKKFVLEKTSWEEEEQKAKKVKVDFEKIFTHFSYILDPSQSIPKKNKSATDIGISPEKACPLIAKKLNNPKEELSIEDSITLLTTCIKYGKAQAEKVREKQGIVVIGNTGTGKSTLLNYLNKCDFEKVHVKALGLNPAHCLTNTVVRVAPTSKKPEIMKIGHTNKSQTFMPEIVTTEEGLTFCDCPGFLDNRGAEINIANKVNIKIALEAARSIKVIILINHHSIMAEKGGGFKKMIQIACNLFGSRENLLKYQESILLGVTQIPLAEEGCDPDPLQDLKDKIANADAGSFDKATLIELSNRLFIYDPMNRKKLAYEGALQRGEIIGKIYDLNPIKSSECIFQTALDSDDEKKLEEITKKMQEQVKQTLKEKNFKKAASLARKLKPLTVIGHSFVNNLLLSSYQLISRYFLERISEFKIECANLEIHKAKDLLIELELAVEEFGADLEIEDLSKLKASYQECVDKKKFQAEKKRVRKEISQFNDHCYYERFDEASQILKNLEMNLNSELQKFEKDITEYIDLAKYQAYFQTQKARYEKTKEEADKFQVSQKIDAFKSYCKDKDFVKAEKILNELKTFGTNSVDITTYETYYEHRVNKTQLQQMKLSIAETKSQFEIYCQKKSFSEADKCIVELERIMKDVIPSSNLKKFEQEIKSYIGLTQLVSHLDHSIQTEVDKKVKEFEFYCNADKFIEADQILEQIDIVTTGTPDMYVNISMLKLQMQVAIDRYVNSLKLRVDQIKERTVFKGHTSRVTALIPLGNGSIASGSGDKKIKIWDPITKNCLKTLEWHSVSETVSHLIQLSEEILVSGSSTGGDAIKLWDLKKGSCLKALRASSVTTLIKVSKEILANVSDNNIIYLWKLNTGGDFKALYGHVDKINDLILLSDGTIASISHDTTIRLWDPKTETCLKTLTGHSASVSALIQLSNGTLVSISLDKTIKIWDPKTGNCLKTIQGGHSTAVTAFIPLSNGMLASASYDETIKIWDLNKDNCVRTLEGGQLAKTLIEGSHGILFSGGDHNMPIETWDLKTGKYLKSFQWHSKCVNILIPLSGGSFASASNDGTIKIWD